MSNATTTRAQVSDAPGVDLDALRAELNTLLDQQIERLYEEVPYAAHHLRDTDINVDHYRRHTIETILRLRMKRTIDALTIHWFTKRDRKMAERWSVYTADEMLHDDLFARDLKAIGVPREEIYSTEPLFATQLLQGYFYYGIEQEGRPLASLTSSYFIEYFTDATQGQWVENLEEALGKEKVSGMRAHVNHDVKDNHLDFVWNVVSSLIETEDDAAALLRHADRVYRLICMYFVELYETTVIEPSPETVAGGVR